MPFLSPLLGHEGRPSGAIASKYPIKIPRSWCIVNNRVCCALQCYSRSLADGKFKGIVKV